MTVSSNMHTSGPWRVVGYSRKTSNFDRTYRKRIFAPSDDASLTPGVPKGSVTVAHAIGESNLNADANACLIAAAPELLAALKSLMRTSESFVNLARQSGEDLRAEAADQTRNMLALARQAVAKAEGKAS